MTASNPNDINRNPAWRTPPAEVLPLEKAVGTVLAHDVTEIVPGLRKGPAFKKGHKVSAADVERLARLGKKNLYVLRMGPDDLHEDEAAEMMFEALRGKNVEPSGPPSEGKINFVAAVDGLLVIDVDALINFNRLEGVICSTRHSHTLVRRGEEVGGTRAIPLVIHREVIQEACRRAGEGVIQVRPLTAARAGVIITGSEVYEGLIEDRFAPVIAAKIGQLGGRVTEVILAPDDEEAIGRAIHKLLDQGVNLLVLTGGMSVDPDDVTRMAVRGAGGRDLVYGSPVLPGAMLLYGRIADVPVLGLPACVMYFRTTVFDLVLPRVLAGLTITREDLARLAHGGFCLTCETCRWPMCPFGKST
ncbi:MAG: molybdopterin-binding protein [Proteobacteria bacterium]|nr:molybdopterin-binding protein [Pseudomonadota bacterium]